MPGEEVLARVLNERVLVHHRVSEVLQHQRDQR
jgi:hypothetical protein